MDEIKYISLLGRKHAIRIPKPPMGIAILNDLNSAWWPAVDEGGMQALRVACAFIGLCTRIGQEAKADYAVYNCRPIVYGGHIFGWLEGQKVSAKEMMDVAQQIVEVVLGQIAPREEEVQAAVNFTKPSGDAPT